MIYLAKIDKPDAIGLIVGSNYADVLKQVPFVVRELGAWDAELHVDTIHASIAPLSPSPHPMRMRFDVRKDDFTTRVVFLVLPEDGGGDMFLLDLLAWIEFARGWLPDGDFEFLSLEVAQAAAN